MKDIIILADFLGPLNGTFNNRFLYLADMLAVENKVEIITSDFDHGRKEYFNYEIEKHNYPIMMLHEGRYLKNISIKRFIGHYKWGKNVKKYLKNRNKPDVIYCAVPTLKASYEAAKYCEKNKIRFIVDIQDLWPDAFRMIFNVPVISDIIFAPFKALANGIYKRADEIFAVSETYASRAMKVNRKCEAEHVVYLGTELATFDKHVEDNSILKKEKKETWIAYCGSLGYSYDIKCVIDALAILGDTAPRFIVMGDGEGLDEFKTYAAEKEVKVTFTDFLDYKNMCAILGECDMVVNPIMPGAAQSIINKHADYAASGLPVLNTQESTEYRNLVDEYHMGFNCINGDATDLAEKIKLLLNDPKLRIEMGRNARCCAEERFDRASTYLKIVKIIS